MDAKLGELHLTRRAYIGAAVAAAWLSVGIAAAQETTSLSASGHIDAQETTASFDGITAQLETRLQGMTIGGNAVEQHGLFHVECTDEGGFVWLALPTLASTWGMAGDQEVNGQVRVMTDRGTDLGPISFSASGTAGDVLMIANTAGGQASALLRSLHSGEHVWLSFAGGDGLSPLHVSIMPPTIVFEDDFKRQAAPIIQACELLNGL